MSFGLIGRSSLGSIDFGVVLPTRRFLGRVGLDLPCPPPQGSTDRASREPRGQRELSRVSAASGDRRLLLQASFETSKLNWFLILPLIAFVVSCQPAATPTPFAVEVQPQPLHFDHPFVVLPSAKLHEEIAKWQFLADPIDELSIAELTVPGKNWPLVTRAEAEQDVRYLFRIFKHGYAGYGAFNADGSFDRAEANILQELSTSQIILSYSLAQLIQSHLSL